MIIWLVLSLFLGLARAADDDIPWHKQPIEPKQLTQGTAYTVGKGNWRVGLFNVDYGLLKNTNIGTSPGFFLPPFALPNVHAKVTGIQTPKFDASAQLGLFYYNLENSDYAIPGGRAYILPIGWTATWAPNQRWGFSAGTDWWLARLTGKMGIDQLAEILAQRLSIDLGDDILVALAGDGSIYAGLNGTVTKARFQAEFRVNRRDSIILSSNTFTGFKYFVLAGYAAEDETKQIGLAYKGEVDIKDQFSAVNTLSWQFSWEHFNLKLGVPIPGSPKWAWIPQAVNLYWVF